MQIGVILSKLCTLLILLAQNFEQLLILRLITGIGLGFTISAPIPIAAELMPAQHRRTNGANLRSDAGDRVHLAAVCRLRARRSLDRRQWVSLKLSFGFVLAVGRRAQGRLIAT
jgi:hypothetical protein